MLERIFINQTLLQGDTIDIADVPQKVVLGFDLCIGDRGQPLFDLGAA